MGAIKSAGFIVILCATYLFAGNSGNGIQPTEYNLICKGINAKSYHNDYRNSKEYCRGLKACRADIIRLPSAGAKELRSDPCDFCYKR